MRGVLVIFCCATRYPAVGGFKQCPVSHASGLSKAVLLHAVSAEVTRMAASAGSLAGRPKKVPLPFLAVS